VKGEVKERVTYAPSCVFRSHKVGLTPGPPWQHGKFKSWWIGVLPSLSNKPSYGVSGLALGTSEVCLRTNLICSLGAT